jgi:low affinity Fe/Cu permease
MAIQIKELHIKVKIEEELVHSARSQQNDPLKIQELKSQLIKECTREVLENLKKEKER